MFIYTMFSTCHCQLFLNAVLVKWYKCMHYYGPFSCNKLTPTLTCISPLNSVLWLPCLCNAKWEASLSCTLPAEIHISIVNRGGVAQWVACLTRHRWIPVSREFEPHQRQETFLSLLSTDWFQERIWAWFT